MRTTLLVLATCVLATFALPEPALGASSKVTICHLPPGNPDNVQTITIGERAVPAHLAHGDTVGACPSGCLVGEMACDDGNLCTTDVCLPNGECSNETVDCDDGNSCTMNLCIEDQGCVNPPADGVPCDDGIACTEVDVCADSVCSGSPIANCCSSAADCDDGNFCTLEQCAGSQCTSDPRDCSGAGDQCNVGFCDPTQQTCGSAPLECDDGNICTVNSCDLAVGCVSVRTMTPPEPGIEITCGDALDNDCDGLVDEADPDCVFCNVNASCSTGNPGICSAGLTACPNGPFGDPVCEPLNDPFVELCDGLDNDCDGFADEDFPGLGDVCGEQQSGVFVCTAEGVSLQCGEPGECSGPASAEVCDRCDNDHDGLVDEDFPNLGAICLVGVGECQAEGFFMCTGDGTGTQCSATTGLAMPEVCDGLDNNCDGQVDEHFIPDDVDNCGGCNIVCSSSNVSVRSCEAGVCTPVCDVGFNDCNDDPLDGCETVGPCDGGP